MIDTGENEPEATCIKPHAKKKTCHFEGFQLHFMYFNKSSSLSCHGIGSVAMYKMQSFELEIVSFSSGNFGCWTKMAGTPYKTNKAVICYFSLSVLLNISHWPFSTSGRSVMVCVLHTSGLSGDNTVVLHTFCVHVAPGIFAVKVEVEGAERKGWKIIWM